MRRLTIILIVAVAAATPLLGIMVANPTPETAFERFGTSVEYTYEKWKIRYPGTDYKLSAQRVFIKPSLGVMKFVDMFGYIGFSDLDIPQDDFSGSSEMAFGLGLRMHYAIFYPAVGCRSTNYPIRWYASASWITTKSEDNIPMGATHHTIASFRFQNFDLALYGSWQFGRVRPYTGVHWTYITGRKNVEYYSSSSTPYATATGLYTDPGQYPRPLIGLDIDLGKGYVLSLESSYLGKSETSISVGLSQLYVSKKEQDGKEQAIERPE